MHALDEIEAWVQLVSGVVVILLGAFMLTLRPRLVPHVAFATFATFFGANFVLSNGTVLFLDQPAGAPAGPWTVVRTTTYVGSLAGAAWVATVFPTPLARHERAYLALPLAAGAANALVLAWASVAAAVRPGDLGLTVFLYVFVAFIAFLSALPAFFALRAAVAPTDAGQRQFALLGAAFAIYPLFVATAGSQAERGLSILDPTTAPIQWVCLGVALLSAALWLRASARMVNPKTGRTVALLCAALPLAGLVYVSLGLAWGALGILRLAMVALLGYGIARHQLLGIDVKVRFALSRSTIAGVFIAVFFIASEVTQEYFGDTSGSTYVGIIAAGALVFGLAPLQRVAEQIAARAVPDAAPAAAAPGGSRSRKEEVYREALRVALRDRTLSRQEDLALARLAEELGIGAGRALQIRHEAETEPGPAT